ncbi:MAG: hypothetical protein EAX96_11735 [Candidatus Lokiarchaeota archaeon]|nr:hypothetical protein [Candidatus Lokiarchaeota archaeon]
MIHDIFIALKKGILLFHKGYVDEQKGYDDDLVSSFLTAIISFAAEMGEDSVESMSFKNLKFVYGIFGKLAVIFLVDKDDNEDLIKKKIKRVGESFLLKYHKILPSWRGNVTLFSEFEIDDIIRSTVKIVFMGPGGVGKTSICKLIKGDMIPVEYIPTIGLNISDIAFSDELGIVCWDLAGQAQFEKTWVNFAEDADIIFLVCDSTEETLREIIDLYQKFKFLERKNITFHVIANKQDLENRLTPEYIQRRISLETFGLVAILPENREKIHRILKMKVGEKIGETFLKIKESKSKRSNQKDELIFYLRNLKGQLSKLIDISDTIFGSINFWIDKIKYYAEDELSEEDQKLLDKVMKDWNDNVRLILEKYYVGNEKQVICPHCGYELSENEFKLKICPECIGELRRCHICNSFINEEDKILKCGFCLIEAHEEHFLKWLEYSNKCPKCSKKITLNDLKTF